MLSKLFLILSLCAPGYLLAQESHYSNFGGVNNFADSMMIADGDAQDAQNVLTDEGDLRTIYGNLLYAVVGSSSISFLKEWVNTSGQRVLFAQVGYNLYATDPSSGTLSSIKYFGSDRDIDMVAAFNRAYFVDGTSGAFYTTGSSTTASTGFEDCKYTEMFQTRLACVNTSTETSKVMLSAYNSPADFTVTSSKDSGAVKYFHKDDGENINCVFATPEGLFIGKDSSVGMLKGSDNETFYWYYISDDVGCSDDRSIQIVDGKLLWLSRDGFYSYDFNKVPQLESAKITNSTKLIRRSNSADSQWTVNTMANWQDGTGDGWEYDIVPGSIKAESYNSGALTDGATSYTRMFEGVGFELGNSTAWTPVLDTVATTIPNCTLNCNPPFATYLAYDGLTTVAPVLVASVTVLNAADDVMVASAALTTAGWYTVPTTGSGDVKLRVTNRLGNSHVGPAFDRALGIQIYYTGKDPQTVGQQYYDVFDAVEIGVASTTVVSVSTDSGFTAPTFYADLEGGNATLNFYASDDNTTFISTTVALPGGDIPSAYNKRYYKYSVTMSSGVSVSSFTSVRISVLSTTAYTSDVHFTADDISAWKLFSVSDSGTAAPIYSVRAATYAFANDAVSPSFTVQPENVTMAISTGSYVQFKINPNISTSADSLTVNSVSIAYSVGQLSPRAASVVDDHRYIASVSHTSVTENDITYIWQKNKEWTFSDQGYGALGLFNNKPMGGSTDTASRLWYILEPTAYTFDGESINSYWITKDYSFSAINNHKVINRLWITAENNGMADFGVAWQANRDGVWNSTTTPLNASGFTIKEVEGLFEQQYPGRQFRFKFTGNELSHYFKLKLFSLYYTVNPLVKD